jgi:hypothetical protein
LIAEGKEASGYQIAGADWRTGALDPMKRCAGRAPGSGGILFVPDRPLLWWHRADIMDEKANNELQKAAFDDTLAIIGTATLERYNEKLSKATVGRA